MKFRSRSAAGLVALAAWTLAGCEVDKQAQPWPAPSEIDVGMATIPLRSGYYKGRAFEFWEAGDAGPATARVYILYRSGNRSPIPFDQQYPIVDAVEGETGYSPFRHVINVTVPASYVANTMRSVSDLEDALYLVQADETFLAWDAPSVRKDATLGGTSDSPTAVWFDGRISYIFVLEEGIRVDRNSGEVAVGKQYEISRAGEILPGNTIFTLRPGEPGYSPLVEQTTVNVTEDYPVGDPPRWQSSIAVDQNIGDYLIDLVETETTRNRPSRSVGAYTLSDADLGFVDDSDPVLYPAGEVTERIAWYNGTMRPYVDLGQAPLDASDVWLIHRVGSGTPIDGQDPIVIAAPGDPGYSPVRRIHRVFLDASAPYTPNSIKSYETLLQTGALDEELDAGWDAPAVNRDAHWDGASPRHAWVNGRTFAFFLLEEDLTVLDDRVSVMSSYEIYRRRDPSDTEGVWLDFNSLIPAVPGMDSYSPVRRVQRVLVKESYADTTWKSFIDATNNVGEYLVNSFTEPGYANRPVRR